MRKSQALAEFHDLAPGEESFRDAVLAGLGGRRKINSLSLPLRQPRLGAIRGDLRDCPNIILRGPRRRSSRDSAARDRRAHRPRLPARRVRQRREPQGPGAAASVRGAGRLCRARHLARATARRHRGARRRLSRSADRRALHRLHASARSRSLPEARGRRIGFFPGSTIGNFTALDAVDFLAGSRHVVGADGAMLVGVDLRKDRAVLRAAYNDAQGVTAAFNLNLLERINRELGADFELDRFAHDAVYNEAAGRIEIYIRSLADQIVTVAGRAIRFAAGERIHTEDSCKYTIEGFHRLASRAGFRPVRTWTDRDRLFSVHFLAAS